MSATGYTNSDGRVELEKTDSGALRRACKHCGLPLADHDRERIVPDDGRGPAGSYHYRYICPDGYAPPVAHGDGGGA